ncbi:hypothetical protein TIFTF001_020150 [Ficus carica]|uniref:Uncharacterized protein n=1 Tax=Ficus carica TaxID=3494 RepID=A0AA88AA70_FICCA|nr:hypothetical protein TIFTF001_020150 [Ficus carica]
MTADQSRKQCLSEMIFKLGNSGESNIFDSNTQNTEATQRHGIKDRSSTWGRGRIINGATGKQQMGEEGGRSRLVRNSDR